MHINRVPVRMGSAGQCVCLALKMAESESSPRKHIKGTVLISPSATPSAAYEFDAKVSQSVSLCMMLMMMLMATPYIPTYIHTDGRVE